MCVCWRVTKLGGIGAFALQGKWVLLNEKNKRHEGEAKQPPPGTYQEVPGKAEPCSLPRFTAGEWDDGHRVAHGRFPLDIQKKMTMRTIKYDNGLRRQVVESVLGGCQDLTGESPEWPDLHWMFPLLWVGGWAGYAPKVPSNLCDSMACYTFFENILKGVLSLQM